MTATIVKGRMPPQGAAATDVRGRGQVPAEPEKNRALPCRINTSRPAMAIGTIASLIPG